MDGQPVTSTDAGFGANNPLICLQLFLDAYTHSLVYFACLLRLPSATRALSRSKSLSYPWPVWCSPVMAASFATWAFFPSGKDGFRLQRWLSTLMSPFGWLACPSTGRFTVPRPPRWLSGGEEGCCEHGAVLEGTERESMSSVRARTRREKGDKKNAGKKGRGRPAVKKKKSAHTLDDLECPLPTQRSQQPKPSPPSLGAPEPPNGRYPCTSSVSVGSSLHSQFSGRRCGAQRLSSARHADRKHWAIQWREISPRER